MAGENQNWLDVKLGPVEEARGNMLASRDFECTMNGRKAARSGTIQQVAALDGHGTVAKVSFATPKFLNTRTVSFQGKFEGTPVPPNAPIEYDLAASTLVVMALLKSNKHPRP